MNKNSKCAISDIPSDAKLCYVDVWGDGDLNLIFTTRPYSELDGDDWDDAPYDSNAGLPYRKPGESGKTFIVKVPGYSPEDCDDEVENPPMREWELLNDECCPGTRFSVYAHLSGACAWMYRYEARRGYSPESVLDAQTTFAQFLGRISEADKAVLEFYRYEEYFD